MYVEPDAGLRSPAAAEEEGEERERVAALSGASRVHRIPLFSTDWLLTLTPFRSATAFDRSLAGFSIDGCL